MLSHLNWRNYLDPHGHQGVFPKILLDSGWNAISGLPKSAMSKSKRAHRSSKHGKPTGTNGYKRANDELFQQWNVHLPLGMDFGLNLLASLSISIGTETLSLSLSRDPFCLLDYGGVSTTPNNELSLACKHLPIEQAD